jgi:hypothetical protein
MKLGEVCSSPAKSVPYFFVMFGGAVSAQHAHASLKRATPTAVFPAKAGTQIHPERLVGFTWAPAFAGETEEEARDSGAP